jgi:hypothetical protein
VTEETVTQCGHVERAIRPANVSGPSERRAFIGGSDARIIMGTDEAALVRLWREKRGEAERPDYLVGQRRVHRPSLSDSSPRAASLW